MFLTPTFRTSYVAVLCGEPPPRIIPPDPAAALLFASRVDREADALLSEGRVQQAERLSHLALEARCRATGSRA